MLVFEARDGHMIYMGKDKFENEHLIKWGWPEDIWFHVDKLSSAHVYLRLKRGPARKQFRETGSLDHLEEALQDCVQLVKANSIEGCKKAAVDIVYTEWENLKKTGGMADGQVGFHDPKKVVTLRGIARDRELVNRINKTKQEVYPDLQEERHKRDAQVVAAQKARRIAEIKAEKERLAKLKEEKEKRDYKHFFDEEQMLSNKEAAEAGVDVEDDFW